MRWANLACFMHITPSRFSHPCAMHIYFQINVEFLWVIMKLNLGDCQFSSN